MSREAKQYQDKRIEGHIERIRYDPEFTFHFLRSVGLINYKFLSLADVMELKQFVEKKFPHIYSRDS